MSSTSKANPLDVEDYLDCFEDVSNELLEHIVNMSDNSVSQKLSLVNSNLKISPF
jgi:hypothetical protein